MIKQIQQETGSSIRQLSRVLGLGKMIVEQASEAMSMTNETTLRHNAGIKEEELAKYPKRIHEVLGGDITADPLPLTDEDYLEIYKKSYR
ncbi:hypothetical protein [Acetobacterium paludosum]|uniref:hypothetical protein n=1 Tax=Acetobacterium paludosum TaxID=52693 RepID=UPI001FA968CB|nr:hypothetical protein [Acetobacterium paludosum]